MEYVPIMRLRQTELKILRKINGIQVFPLLEVVDGRLFARFSASKFNFSQPIMIDLPLYLVGTDNKYLGGVVKILNSIQGASDQIKQVKFYKANAANIGIPVISGPSIRPVNYADLKIGYAEIDKELFKRAAIRFFVNSINLSQKNIDHFQELVESLRDADIILLDVVEFDGVESNVVANLDILTKLIPSEKKANTFVLNAFDIGDSRKNIHHYAPLLTKMFALGGFGDFATIPRFESAGGGGGTTSIIRYMVGWEKELNHTVSLTSFADAKRKLKAKTIWADAKSNGHFASCDRCKEIDVLDTEWKTFWKMFRIEHHINTVLGNTIPDMTHFAKPEDFDMRGHNEIYKNTGRA